MIECQDILEMCDMFEAYLMPLDIHVLRQRYNGQTLKSTYAVAKEMGISDETVRTVENRALEALAHCLHLQANHQRIEPLRLAKSFKPPFAGWICQGRQRLADCPRYTAHRGELLIHSVGHLIGRVMLVDCLKSRQTMGFYSSQWQLYFERPEVFPEPIPYAGTPSYFSIDPEVARQLPPQYSYQY
jgi:hypothetical protein